MLDVFVDDKRQSTGRYDSHQTGIQSFVKSCRSLSPAVSRRDAGHGWEKKQKGEEEEEDLVSEIKDQEDQLTKKFQSHRKMLSLLAQSTISQFVSVCVPVFFLQDNMN